MAKKKKRRSPRPVAGPATASRGGANVARRERKEEARQLREAERRRARRASALRRTVTSVGIAAAAVAVLTVYRSFGGPNEIPDPAVRAATAAGCGEIEHRPDVTPPSPNNHLAPGETYTYPDPPATSGPHNPSPLPDEPKVFTSPIDETAAVHSMEHGAVFVYYRPPDADGGLPQDIVDRLAAIAEQSDATFLAPYPDLTSDRALTLTAWNYRESCPAGPTDAGEGLTAQTAAIIVNGFVTGFECTGEAPENGAPPC